MMSKRGGGVGMDNTSVGVVPLSRFGVLVAQLESIAASARQQPPDPLLCFDLLSELVASIQQEPKESIQLWQRKCEEALFSLLALGARRPIRRLASVAMGRVISKGDGISIYSRASSLQGWLVDNSTKRTTEPLSCSGVAHCLGELYRLFGRRITSGLVETANIAAKLMKFHEDFVRQDALQMLENALEGSGGSGAFTAYSETFRIIMRVGVSDKSCIVRLAAARCLKTFAGIGGPGLGITELENSILHCIKAFEDPVSSVRDAFSEALGALLALAMNPEAQKVKQRGKNPSVPAKKLEDGLQKHLISPFIRATGTRAKDLRIGLTLSWVFFLQVIRLKYHLPDSELQNFSLQAMEVLQGNASVDAHALACVLYILRVGVADQMTEPTQRNLLVLLGRKLESADYSPSEGVATLRILSYLLKTLGEVPCEFRDILDNTVVAALSHSSIHVRVEASLTLRALAEVDPTCVGGLISYGVTTLHALRETASISKGNHMSLQLDSLHGQATVLAALVFISPKLLLGYPARLPKSVFEVSKKMLIEFSRNPMAATVEKESGWLLLGSLIASMPKEELEDQVFDVLLLWADPFVGNFEAHLRQTWDLTSEIRVLSAAIEALTAFIKSFVSPATATHNGGVLLQPVLAYLSGALECISSLAANQLQSSKPALDLFTIRTLMAYQSISNPMAYQREHAQIMQICNTPFSDPSGSEESSCLRFLLDKRDACLGPWIPGKDWFEDELRAFDGGKDGLVPCVWEDELSSFPQPEPISKLLVNQKLLCFGTIFASQDDSEKMMLLKKIDQCLKSGKKQSWHVANITNACVALLAGLKAVLALRLQPLGTEILSSIQSTFQSILAEGEICSAQRRASSEGLGLLARVGNDIFTARMTRTLLGELVAATDRSYTGSIALSLGCIHRSAGGMALSTLVPATVNSISSLAKSSNAGLQLWTLHALLLTIEAAGLSFVSQVQATLFLAMEILLSEESGLVDLRQEIGHLVNAVVAVLGPELAPGSTFFSRCKSVIAEISSCQETSTLLESVRFTQQLVLFAPQAVSVHFHVESLLPTLTSRQPSLRYLAVSTLRHLIEKDPIAMIDEKIEENLFSILNEETDSEIGTLVRTTITGLLYTSCPSCPSRWLSIFHNMVLASSTKTSSEKHGGLENDPIDGTSESGVRSYYGEDDEGMISSSNGDRMHGPDSGLTINSRRDKHLRYRTRVFAAQCLSYLPTAVGTEPAHFDLSLARKQPVKGHSSSADWLVLHLQELISLSYQISTSQFEGMQPIGVRLLCTIMDKFGNVPDPELPGHLLLEQYQAQLVSAVRSSLNMSSSPLLLEAGLQLATKILTSTIISGDRVALNRMFSLISRPLDDIKDLYYPSFAEWVACKIKVRLLAAHASIKCYVYQFLKDKKAIPEEYLQLIPLFSSSSSILGKYWIGVLKDYTYICFGLHLKFSYKPFLDGIQSPLVSSKVQNCLEESWPLILQATALDAIPVNSDTCDSYESNVEVMPETSFTSGYSMVSLEPSAFQYLWGLALLILFQAQQPVVGGQIKASFLDKRNKSNGDQMLEEDNDIILYEGSLTVVQSLSERAFFRQEYLTLDLCKELVQVLIYSDIMAGSWNSLIFCLLSRIVHYCPDVFFEAEDFATAATELYFKHLLLTFQSNDKTSQNYPSGKDFLSKLPMIAETIEQRIKNKKIQGKLIIAFMSLPYRWFMEASTKLCLEKVIAFLQNIIPFLKKYIRDEVEFGIDNYAFLERVVEVWASVLANFSQDCMKRISILKAGTSDQTKLLAKMHAFCLEEVVALTRLVHETQHFGQGKDRAHILQFIVFKHCTKCIRDTFYDTNIQIRLAGLHVLKTIAQRELSEGPHMKDHSFSLFFIGEFLEDIFLSIRHTLMGSISRDSIAVTEECLRLLFLFHTLSQTKECLQAVLILLLEALVMVFTVSTKNHSQEIIDVKNIARRLVAHLVQIPAFAVQIKDVMLSMPVSRRQQLQDMIRASVAQGQTVMQNKFNVQSERATAEVHKLNVQGVTGAHDEKHDRKEEDDSNDDEDWDAFQSLPANNETHSTSDSGVDNPEFLAAESSVVEMEDCYEKNAHYPDLHLLIVSEVVVDTENVEAMTDKERAMVDGKENEECSDLHHSKDAKDEVEKHSDLHHSDDDGAIGSGSDNIHQEPSDRHLTVDDESNSSFVDESSIMESSDQYVKFGHHQDIKHAKLPEDSSDPRNMECSIGKEGTCLGRNELDESSDSHFQKEVNSEPEKLSESHHVMELKDEIHGVVTSSKAFEDGSATHDDVFSASKDAENGKNEQGLHHEENCELKDRDSEDGFHKHSEEMLSIVIDNVQETGSKHLHHEASREQ